MPPLSREAFLSAKPLLKRETVSVPELGEGAEVLVQEMTAAAREKYAAGITFLDEGDLDEEGNPKAKTQAGETYARLAVATVVGEDGEPLFTEADIPALCGYPAKAMERIGKAALRLNGMGSESLEEARKN